MTTLVVDNREHDLIELCKTHALPYTIDTLEVGDMVLRNETDMLVFERKTVADLAASIKDGRFREQKQRLLSTLPPHRITYIIEGLSLKKLSTTKVLHGIQTSALLSAMLSLTYRDGFHVIQTSNTLETMYTLKEIRNRMDTSPEKIRLNLESNDSDYLNSIKVKTKKSDNLTPDLCYLLQLGQIPGFSTAIASDIAKVYPTMSILLQAMKDGGAKTLKDIPGIGPKKAETMIMYLK